MKFCGNVIKYGNNVDTDVIIPARYLNTIDKKELASHCMEDLDATFVTRVKAGDIMVAGDNFGCGSSVSMPLLQLRRVEFRLSLQRTLQEFSTATPLISGCRSSNVPKRLTRSARETSLRWIWTRALFTIKQPERALIPLLSRRLSRISFQTAD